MIVTLALAFAALSVVVLPLLFVLALCVTPREGDVQQTDSLGERPLAACESRSHMVFRDLGMPDRRGVR
jgi:hypothetical protein